jgi:hypothetical protein
MSEEFKKILTDNGVEVSKGPSSKEEREEFVKIMLNWFQKSQKLKLSLVNRETQHYTPLKKL